MTDCTFKKSQRIDQSSKIQLRITVPSDADGAMTIVLPDSGTCDAPEVDEGMLASRLELIVTSPVPRPTEWLAQHPSSGQVLGEPRRDPPNSS